MMAAMRLGGGPHIPDTEKAIADAIELAKDSDAVICVIGSNMDWEAEGADREGIELPGKTDELVSRLLAVRPDAVICNQSVSRPQLVNGRRSGRDQLSAGFRVRLPMGRQGDHRHANVVWRQ